LASRDHGNPGFGGEGVYLVFIFLVAHVEIKILTMYHSLAAFTIHLPKLKKLCSI